jgi:hypothetical protein
MRYSSARFQWLALAISGMTIVTISAQELWGTNPTGIYSAINFPFFYVYITLYMSIILAVNVKDYSRICARLTVLVPCSIISTAIDVGVLSISELFVLFTIGQLATDLIKSLACISMVVLPWSLGEIALSTLTVEYLRKRAEKLQQETEKLRKEAEVLDRRRVEDEQKLAEFERKRKEFSEIDKAREDRSDKDR